MLHVWPTLARNHWYQSGVKEKVLSEANHSVLHKQGGGAGGGMDGQTFFFLLNNSHVAKDYALIKKSQRLTLEQFFWSHFFCFHSKILSGLKSSEVFLKQVWCYRKYALNIGLQTQIWGKNTQESFLQYLWL